MCVKWICQIENKGEIDMKYTKCFKEISTGLEYYVSECGLVVEDDSLNFLCLRAINELGDNIEVNVNHKGYENPYLTYIESSIEEFNKRFTDESEQIERSTKRYTKYFKDSITGLEYRVGECHLNGEDLVYLILQPTSILGKFIEVDVSYKGIKASDIKCTSGSFVTMSKEDFDSRFTEIVK